MAETILVTGAAGFIGFHTSQILLARGDEVVGLDNLNDYYDPALKRARLDGLEGHAGFRFAKLGVADLAGVTALARRHRSEITGVIHLAAQAGVRHSLTAPFDYVRSNLDGHMVILEACRHELPKLEHLVYASSSSVYGGNTKIPFAVEDRVDQPISLYAATKRANELMSHCYAHLYGMAQTGLRFFTVYCPWGRPDMAA
jgi:UDP-glucuronate 4-epimerase